MAVAGTSLGPLAGGLRLADIGPADRLAELDFELPLAGGDHADAEPDRTAPTGGPGGRRRRPRSGDPYSATRPAAASASDPDDPLHGYPDALAAPGWPGSPCAAT